MEKKKISLIIAFIFFSITIFAQGMSFDDWDKDNDGLIEKNEFMNTFVEEYYDVWGPSNTPGLIEEGIFKEYFAGLDSDDDNLLSDEEWIIGYNYFYQDYVGDESIYFVDANADGKIDYDEYYSVMYDTKYFSDIDNDRDNYISEYELADYVFDNWDFNNSETISSSEYARFDWYYLDV